VTPDLQLYLDINNFARHTAWLHGFMAAYALWGALAILAALLVLGWWRARFRTDATHAVAIAMLTGLSTMVALATNRYLLSPTFGRVRPCHTVAHAEVLLSCNGDYSMPSDHCIIAGAFVAGLLVLHRRLGSVAAVLAVLLAFGRVYVGVHYPADAVVGLLAGAGVCLLLLLALRRPVEALTHILAGTPLRALVVSGADSALAAGPLASSAHERT
jgi:membrane-associated phospholipid phosphatase